MNFWNGEVLAIHLTEKCNFNCSYCYLTSERQGVVKYEDIQLAVKNINPDTLFLYGGEPLLCKDLLLKVVEKYPDKQIIFETNGSLLTEELMNYMVEKNVGIIISLDSYCYELNNLGRPMKHEKFQELLKIIVDNRNYPKLRLMCSIYEQTSDFSKFVEISKMLGVQFEQYLIVTDKECNITETPFYLDCQNYSTSIKERLVSWHEKPNTQPKLRLHCNGMISRTLNYVPEQAICNVAEWDDSKRNLGVLPYPKSCRKCECFHKCNLLATFPYWAYELEQKGVLHKTFACQASKLLAL